MTKARTITWTCVAVVCLFYTTYMIFKNADWIRHTYHTFGGQVLPCTDVQRYQQMRQELSEVCHKLNQANVSYWLDDGTLLGIIREDGVMRHDSDVDVAYMYTDFENVKKVVPNPYRYGRYTDLYRYQVYQGKYMIRKCESQSWYYKLNVIKNIVRYMPTTWYLPTRRLGGDGDYSHCRIPVNYHEILRSKFGERYIDHVACDEKKEFITPTDKKMEPAFC